MEQSSKVRSAYNSRDVRHDLIGWYLAILFEELSRTIAELWRVVTVPMGFVVQGTVTVRSLRCHGESMIWSMLGDD